MLGRVRRKLENRDGFLKAIKASAIFERGQCVRHGHRKGHSAPDRKQRPSVG